MPGFLRQDLGVVQSQGHRRGRMMGDVALIVLSFDAITTHAQAGQPIAAFVGGPLVGVKGFLQDFSS